MDFNSIINDVNSKEDFMNFLTQLRLDKQQKSEEWENDEITSYLEGICSWVDDMEGYFDNMHIEMPTTTIFMMETATRFERKDLKEPTDARMMEETG